MFRNNWNQIYQKLFVFITFCLFQLCRMTQRGRRNQIYWSDLNKLRGYVHIWTGLELVSAAQALLKPDTQVRLLDAVRKVLPSAALKGHLSHLWSQYENSRLLWWELWICGLALVERLWKKGSILDKQQFAIHGDLQWRFLKAKKSLSVNLGAFQTSSTATQRAPSLGVWVGDGNWQGNGQLWLNVRVIGLNVIFILTTLKCKNTRWETNI